MKSSYLSILLLLCSSLNAKQIAITFDDAPLAGSSVLSGEEKTQKIIQHLTHAKVPDALFFVTTGNIRSEADSKRLKAYTNAGFHLAHHSHTHLSANRSETKDYLADFDKAATVLRGYEGVINLHRHPFLHYGLTPEKRTEIADHLKQQDYGFGYVTVDNFDWYLNAKLLAAKRDKVEIDDNKLGQLYVDTLWQNIEFYDALAVEHLGRSPKHVLLLHENEMAALYLDKLLAHIKAQGWEIISPQEAYQDPIAKVYKPDTFKFNKQGRVASVLHRNGVAKDKLRHPNENTDFLDALFKQYQVFK